MKRNYDTPEMLLVVLNSEDICTVSAGTLADGEVENTNQWWLSGNLES